MRIVKEKEKEKKKTCAQKTMDGWGNLKLLTSRGATTNMFWFYFLFFFLLRQQQNSEKYLAESNQINFKR
jgi:hypothetical protein